MIIFNGQTLDDYGICGDPEITTAPFSVTMEDGASFDGARFIGSNLKPGKASFKMAILGDGAERRMTLSRLTKAIKVDEPKPLYLPDSPDWYYLAVPDFDMTPERHFGGEVIDLSFTLIDPVAYGEEKSAFVGNGGSVTFTVGGTAPTYPYFANTLETPDSTTQQWGIRLDGQDVFVLNFGTTANRYVRADFAERVAYISDTLKLPTLDSDWFMLTPGEHTIENHIGTGNKFNLCWRERWL